MNPRSKARPKETTWGLKAVLALHVVLAAVCLSGMVSVVYLTMIGHMETVGDTVNALCVPVALLVIQYIYACDTFFTPGEWGEYELESMSRLVRSGHWDAAWNDQIDTRLMRGGLADRILATRRWKLIRDAVEDGIDAPSSYLGIRELRRYLRKTQSNWEHENQEQVRDRIQAAVDNIEAQVHG